MVDPDGNPITDPLLAEDQAQESEKWSQAAQRRLASEVGRIRLESVQARLAGVMFLLNTSRLNEAWFLFGTAWQLAIAMGIHRASSLDRSGEDYILRECKKRTFWTAYTLDTYLSVVLGRLTLIPEHGADQKYPELANDEELTKGGIVRCARPKDCVTVAPNFHAQLACIVREALNQQHHLHRANISELISTASRLN